MLAPHETVGAQRSELPACPTDQLHTTWNNCFGTFTFHEGSTYIGDYRDGKFNGQGTFTFHDGAMYVGGYKDNNFNGQGTLTYPDGTKHVGEFKDGKLHGQSIRYSRDGSVLEIRTGPDEMNDTGSSDYQKEVDPDLTSSQYVPNTTLGSVLKVDMQRKLPPCSTDPSIGWSDCFGTLTAPNGQQYVGDWLNGKFHGQGTLTWPDGRKYIGNFIDGAQSGQGKSIFPNGENYSGEFRSGRRDGHGTYIWPDGRKYVGDFRGGKFNGQGTFTLPNGEKYVGEFLDDNRNGQGTTIWPNGQKYVGEFRDDQQHGRGTLIFPNGQQYVGEWRNGKFSGQGTYIFPDVGKFVGEYRNGKRNGQGILYSPAGVVVQMGIWEEDSFVRQTFVSPPAPLAAPKNPPVLAIKPPPPTIRQSSSGSGFRIADGQFVTNHHVVDSCAKLSVDDNYSGRVLASDPTRDLAVVTVTNDRGDIAKIRTTRIQLNENISTTGFPLEGALSGIAITTGTISRLSGLGGDTGEVQISAPVQPGNSGGPLLDTAGNVIGVVSR